jgi:hypothetical protein
MWYMGVALLELLPPVDAGIIFFLFFSSATTMAFVNLS